MNNNPQQDAKLQIIPVSLENLDKLSEQDRHIQNIAFARHRRQALGELRCLSGIPQIFSSLSPGNVYRVAIPKNTALQKEAGGLYQAVIRDSNGQIVEHVKLEKVGPNLAKAASAVGSQIMLVSLAMQLNEIDREIQKIQSGQHDDRMAEVAAGIKLYERGGLIYCEQKRYLEISNAIKVLTIGIEKAAREMRQTLQTLPPASITRGANWGLRSLHEKAERSMAQTPETLEFFIRGAEYLTKAYAALDEPRVATHVVKDYLTTLKEFDLKKAADVARLLPNSNSEALPETPWQKVLEFTCGNIEDQLNFPGLAGNEENASQPVAIDVKPEEILEQTEKTS